MTAQFRVSIVLNTQLNLKDDKGVSLTNYDISQLISQAHNTNLQNKNKETFNFVQQKEVPGKIYLIKSEG